MPCRLATYLLALIVGSSPLLAHGDLHVLIADLDEKLEQSPDNTKWLLERANYYRLHKKFELALVDFNKAKKLNPSIMECHLGLAKVYLDQKNTKLAKSEIDFFIEAKPKHSEARVLRSQIYAEIGMNNAAEEDLKQAIQLSDQPSLKLYLKYINFLVQNDKVDVALKVYSQAEQTVGSAPTLMPHKARMLRDQGHWNEASIVYAQLRNLLPNLSFTWWMEEARMWENQNIKKARQAFLGAQQSWKFLPARTRALSHMKRQHKEMQTKLNYVE